jgi:hypothetical protein
LRLSVVASVVLHIVVLLVALRLPALERRAPSAPIEVDVQAKRPVELPPPPPPLTPPEPKLAMKEREPRERVIEPRKKEEREQPQPEPTPVPPSPLPPPSHSAPPGKVDLTLHALPGSSGGGVVLPAAPSSGGTFGTGAPPAPRKEWKPRGDAGDPILGHIREEKVERFPLEKVGTDEYVYKGPQFSAHIRPDGSVSFDDKYIRDFNGTSGSWDMNDLIMRGKKQDPYRAEKEAFMRATEAQRTEIARRARRAEMAASLAGLSSHLERVWGDRRVPAKDRRATLFELWRDAYSGEGDEGDAGARARSIIESFIRNRLPQGSEEAFTDEELATYARSSKQHFQPYR